MDRRTAERAIESLREGLPPHGLVRHFTVGREQELRVLSRQLEADEEPGALLLADYGSGKTHLLQLLREVALDAGFAVSCFSVESKAQTRLNRMDQVLGAVLRHLEVPGQPGTGPATLLNAVADAVDAALARPRPPRAVAQLSGDGKWKRPGLVNSAGLGVAVRAWYFLRQATSGVDLRLREELLGWLQEPWNYYSRRKELHARFVSGLSRHFQDSWPEWKYYEAGEAIFNFQAHGYHQAWSALSDLDALAEVAGLRGLVLLIDEVEDIVYSLDRINLQESAFLNIFEMFDGRFNGTCFCAVTPAFVQKCIDRLLDKGRYEFDIDKFHQLPSVEFTPIASPNLAALAGRILEAHAAAYAWRPPQPATNHRLATVLEAAEADPANHRVRGAIKSMVAVLDQAYGGSA